MQSNTIQLIGAGIAIGVAGSLAVSSFIARPKTALATTGANEILQPEGAEGMGDMQDQQAMMDAWMASMTPGDHHAMLQHFVGSWDIKTKVWWGGPGTPAIESGGTSEVESVLDGRFVREHMTGEFKMPGENGEMMAMPMNGIGMAGYDNNRNMFVSTWTDNFTTAIHVWKGSSMDGKVFTYYGEMDEPMMGVYGRMVKYRITIQDENNHLFEMYDLHAGDDYKVFEIDYTRK